MSFIIWHIMGAVALHSELSCAGMVAAHGKGENLGPVAPALVKLIVY
jgi:hypothetical protein